MKLYRYPDLVEMRLVNNRMGPRRLAATQNFPLPVSLGPNSIAWLADEVDAWLAGRTRVVPAEMARAAEAQEAADATAL